MEEFQLAKNILEQSQTIALAPGEDLKGDTFAASLALLSILKKIGKKPMILTQEIPDRLRFLQEERFLSGQEAVLAVDIKNKNLTQLRYEKTEDKLKIYLGLENCSLRESDIAIWTAQPINLLTSLPAVPDALVTLGVLRLELLEKMLPDSNLLVGTPILNIDNSLENKSFGSLNIVDPTNPSISEIVGDFIFSEYEELIDKHIATILLAGLLLGCQNFRHPNTGPKTFRLAASLLEKGADHQLVVKYLYKTRSATQLRLLGKALENIMAIEEKNLTFTSLTKADFKTTKTSSKDLAFVFEELKTNFWKTDSLLLLWESHGSAPLVKGIFCSKNRQLLEKLLQNFNGISREKTALFLVREPLLERAKEKVLSLWPK